MRIVAIANQKGGCGKTTTSINLAASLAFLRKKTLLLDLDPQGHSTCGLGIQTSQKPRSLYDFLSPLKFHRTGWAEALYPFNDYLSILPTYSTLSALEEELMLMPDRDLRLKQLLGEDDFLKLGYEHVLLDCPPNLGLLSYNALFAADEIIIPVEPSFFSLHGLAKMSETIDRINRQREKPLYVHALLTLFNSDARFSQEVYEEVRKHFQGKLFTSIIHENSLFKEAASAGSSIVEFSPSSPASRDYIHLAKEYLERQWDHEMPQQKLGWDNVVHEHFGPKKVPGGVLFQVQSPNASWVEIAGDFNQWIPEPMVRSQLPGMWQKVIPIGSGKYRYKFIIDGEWQMDPYHPVRQQNAYGTYDSYLEI